MIFIPIFVIKNTILLTILYTIFNKRDDSFKKRKQAMTTVTAFLRYTCIYLLDR